MQPGKSPRRRAALVSFAAFALACAIAPAWALSALSETSPGVSVGQVLRSTDGNGAYVPGEAIVRFAPGISAAERRAARAGASVELEEPVGLPRTQLVGVDGSVPAAIRRLEAQPGVAYAQPNYRYEATAVPDDTFFGELWGLSDPATPDPGLGALDAWETTKGGGEVIAVLDTGVDLTHPDLEGNLWTNPNPDPVDKDVHGFDFVDDDGNPDDFNFHGTHVAGTAAAVADNTQGIAGVAPQAQVMAVRVLDGNGSGSTVEIAEGIEYAADHGADVINMSLGGPAGAGDKAMADAIAAAGAKDVVVVVAAGNEAADNEVEPESPCVLPQANLICVAALNRSGSLAGFSNFGAKSVDLAAPGTSILSSKPDYGPPVFEDGFEVSPSPWSTAASGGGLPWALTKETAASGEFSAADSPAGDYGHSAPGAEEPAASELFTTDPVSLAGERGCRMHFNTKYEIESGFDFFAAGAVTGSSLFDGTIFDGASPGFPGSFIREETSVSKLDGEEVQPFFGVFSDEEVELDGAYVDDVRLFCRDETYLDAIATGSNYDQPESGSYVRFQGTSMATPHVAGEVALVRAAAPALDAQEVVKAILDGTSAIPVVTTGKRTVTEGIADACKAIAIATGGDVATQCPASSEPTPQPPPGPSVKEIEEQIINANPPASPETMEQILRRRIPQTLLRRHPAKLLRTARAAARAVFRFAADESGATFLCKFDRAAFRPCRSRIVWHAEPGRHVLRVKARDSDGNVDATPAVFRFRVERAG